MTSPGWTPHAARQSSAYFASHHLPGVSEGGGSQSKATPLPLWSAGEATVPLPTAKPRSRGLQAFNKAIARKESGSPNALRHNNYTAVDEEGAAAAAANGGARSNGAEDMRYLLHTLQSYVHAAREPGAWPEYARAELTSLEKQAEDVMLLTAPLEAAPPHVARHPWLEHHLGATAACVWPHAWGYWGRCGSPQLSRA